MNKDEFGVKTRTHKWTCSRLRLSLCERHLAGEASQNRAENWKKHFLSVSLSLSHTHPHTSTVCVVQPWNIHVIPQLSSRHGVENNAREQRQLSRGLFTGSVSSLIQNVAVDSHPVMDSSDYKPNRLCWLRAAAGSRTIQWLKPLWLYGKERLGEGEGEAECKHLFFGCIRVSVVRVSLRFLSTFQKHGLDILNSPYCIPVSCSWDWLWIHHVPMDKAYWRRIMFFLEVSQGWRGSRTHGPAVYNVIHTHVGDILCMALWVLGLISNSGQLFSIMGTPNTKPEYILGVRPVHHEHTHRFIQSFTGQFSHHFIFWHVFEKPEATGRTCKSKYIF